MKKILLVLAFVLSFIGFTELLYANGEEPASPEDWFTVEEVDGGVAITGYDREKAGNCEKVVIPSRIGGKKVVELGARAFYGERALTNVVIPEWVEKIDTEGFVGSGAFVEVDPKNAFFSSDGGALFDKNKKTLLYVAENPLFDSYTLPESVERIDKRVFSFGYCSSLKSVVITEGTEKIDLTAFIGNSITVEVDPKNAKYSSEDGVLFDKNKKTLLYFPNSRESYAIPAGVEIIGDAAFYNCWNLKSVVIPEGVKIIGDFAFGGCHSLANPILPKSLESIGDYAFWGCSNLNYESHDNNDEYGWDYSQQTSLFIPEGVKSIGQRAFGFTGATIEVDPKNTSYCCEDGVLYDKNKKTLLRFPGNAWFKPFVIPESVESIGEWAFCEFAMPTYLYGKSIDVSATIDGSSQTNFVFPGVFAVCADYAGASGAKISIPQGVTNISSTAFASGAYFEVDPKNTAYASEDGILFDKDRKTLLRYPVDVVPFVEVDPENDQTALDPFNTGVYNGIYGLPDGVDLATYLSEREKGRKPKPMPYNSEDGDGVSSVETVQSESSSHGIVSSKSDTIDENVETVNGLCDEVDFENEANSLEDETLLDENGETETIGVIQGFDGFSDEELELRSRDINEGVLGTSADDMNQTSRSTMHKESDPSRQEVQESVASDNDLSPETVSEEEDETDSPKDEVPHEEEEDEQPWFLDPDSNPCAVPEGVERIGSFAFKNCSSITRIDMPEGVALIGVAAFEDCRSLVRIDIPTSVKQIGSLAFYGCSSLTSVVIPKGANLDGQGAFYGCSSLKNVVLPEGMTSIGECEFCNCCSLKTLDVPKSVKEIGDNAFFDCPAKLRVYKGSYAETWAREHNREYETID
ncbi:MAG: leucine-rich repeat domain-containing protein [Thermoguttaceae bacterium]|nr:leucine-rich repeat domain-containing protein [Thermoguttaceae bacterium]